MDVKTDPGYSLDAYSPKTLAEAWRTDGQSKTTLINDLPAEQFFAENAWSEDDVAGVFPESPWQLVLMIVALIGILVDFLFE